VIHGLAGSAAVALLVLAAIPDPLWAVIYLGIFGLGTVAGMMVVTAALGVPFALTGERALLHRRIRLVSGAISIAFGLVIAYQVSVTQGLFSSTPSWTPK
jgi:high-affinity nickel-transport protein